MSTYQYYEFHAIDRPLTPKEQQAVARLSSRVDPHPRRAIFTYSWSDFPGRAKDVLAQYYDAMLYMANWGSRRLMFRFPQALIDLEQAGAYCQSRYAEEFISFSSRGEYVVLTIEFHDEEGGDWIEGKGWLDMLIPLREDILRGDYRALYLAWLKTLEMEDVLDSVIEPPLPPGLRELSPALRHFVDLFEIDKDLIKVAAEASGGWDTASDGWVRRAILELARKECDAFLLRLARGEPHLALAFNKRLRELAGAGKDIHAPQEELRRTVGQLLAAAQALWERQRREQAAKAEARRIAELEALARRQAQVWEEVETLIQRSQAKSYAKATQLLGQLKELAAYQGRKADFEARMGEIVERYSRRPALMRRLRQAGLISQEEE